MPPSHLNIHFDRGKVMRSKPVALMLSDLGVTKTHRRPYVSVDNQKHFHTLTAMPGFPRHAGIAMLTLLCRPRVLSRPV